MGGQIQRSILPDVPSNAIMTFTNPGAPGNCYDGTRGTSNAFLLTRRPGATSRVFSGSTGVGVMDTLDISSTLSPTSTRSKYWATVKVTTPSGTVQCATTVTVSAAVLSGR